MKVRSWASLRLFQLGWLFGAHVDHQHGLVTGFAIDKGVDLWFDVNEDGFVNLTSRTFEGDDREVSGAVP